jgi:hypothetical protein
MAKYLRDEQISNVAINSEALNQLTAAFFQRGTMMPEYRQVEEGENPTVFLTYTCRFDQKGYRVHDPNELLAYFEQASEIERIVIQLQSAESLRTNGSTASQATLRLDAKESNSCFLTVDSDSEEWMNGTFGALKEVLDKCGNRNGLFRNPIVDVLVQLFGLMVGFIVSLWGASLISKQLTIENSFLISFFLVIVMFSNLWAPLRVQLQNLLSKSFPNIKFYRPQKDKMHWLLQALVGGVVVGLTLFLLNFAFSYVGNILGAFIQVGT